MRRRRRGVFLVVSCSGLGDGTSRKKAVLGADKLKEKQCANYGQDRCRYG